MFSLFEEADDDKSGLIDLDEMNQLLAKCEVEMDAGDLKKLFGKYDGDGSGQISFREFFMMIKELLDVAASFLQDGAGHLDESGESPLAGSGAIPLRMSLAEDMDAAYREAEQLALEAEKKRLQVKAAPTAGPAVEGGAPEGDSPPKPRPALRRSLLMFSPNNPFRRAAKAFLDYPPWQVENKWFDTVILLGILASSALLALDNPGIGDDSPMRKGLDNAGLFLNGLFIIECVCKVLVLSFRDYIASGWNKLDFLIVSTSCLDLGLTYGLQGQEVDVSALKIFRMLRILRALRPLRIIARAKGLKILVRVLLTRPTVKHSYPTHTYDICLSSGTESLPACFETLTSCCPVALLTVNRMNRCQPDCNGTTTGEFALISFHNSPSMEPKSLSMLNR
jgi:hypothetical protein